MATDDLAPHKVIASVVMVLRWFSRYNPNSAPPSLIKNMLWFRMINQNIVSILEPFVMMSTNGNFSPLLALCVGNPPVIGGFPSLRPVTRSLDVYFDLRLNKQLGKRSRRRWFEKPSRLLWRHCNVSGARSRPAIGSCYTGAHLVYALFDQRHHMFLQMPWWEMGVRPSAISTVILVWLKCHTNQVTHHNNSLSIKSMLERDREVGTHWFSLYCMVGTFEVWDTTSPAHWMPTHKPTEKSRIKLKLELNSPSLSRVSIQLTWLHCRNWFTPGSSDIFAV